MTDKMQATASIPVHAPLDRVYRAIADPLAYPRVDSRVTELALLSQNGRRLRLRVRGYVLSSMLESGVVLRVTVHSPRRVEFESEPGSISLPGRLILQGLRGELLLERRGLETQVTRTETYVTTNNFFGRLAARLGETWLKRHLEEIQLPRLKQVLEAAP